MESSNYRPFNLTDKDERELLFSFEYIVRKKDLRFSQVKDIVPIPRVKRGLLVVIDLNNDSYDIVDSETLLDNYYAVRNICILVPCGVKL